MVSKLRYRLKVLFSKKRFGKFVSVGAVGAVFDIAILVLLVEFVGITEEIAVIIGIESAILLMFVLNDTWTYADMGKSSYWALFRRLVKSHAVRSGGAVTQFVVFVIVYRYMYIPIEFAGLATWLLVAKGAGIALGMMVNYTFETLFTWAVGDHGQLN